MQVGMTEACDAGADQDLARSGLLQADVLDHKWLVDFMQDGGLHQFLPSPSDCSCNGRLLQHGAYAAASNSPTWAMPAARSPSRRSVMARCVALSARRNGSLADIR